MTFTSQKYIMAMDQGTTSCRAILFDRQGTVVSLAQRELAQIYPKPGWVEHDPEEIWELQRTVSQQAMRQAGACADEIAAIGITNQRETTVVWNRHTGRPVCNAIVWQCRRTADRIERLKQDGLSDYVHQTTGLIPDAYFSASKIAWILENTPGAQEAARAGDLLFGTIDTWLVWNLTGGQIHATDYTNASRTMLYDIHRLCWDDRIRSYFAIPESMLPAVQPSGSLYGYTDASIFGGSIPIAGVAGDQQAALFGQCCFAPGDAKNTYGTGCFLLMHTGTDAVHTKSGLLTTIAAGTEGEPVQYAREGSIFAAGAAIQWLRDEMGLIRSGEESEQYALSVEDTNGVYVVPAFTGLGAPYWDPYARGTITGLTRGSSRAHIVRAVLESIAYQTSDILALMEEESGMCLQGLRVDGGASQNEFLMQFQADLLGRDVCRPACVETTALGAADLAGLTTGFWQSTDELQSNCAIAKTYQPAMPAQRRAELKKGWARAVERARGWAEE